MLHVRQINPVLRAVGVIGAVAALVTSITFAALSSSATLTNSSISTATASLKVWDGDSFEPNGPGFTITNHVPGSATTPAPFYFKNDGGVPLNVTARITAAPLTTNVGNFADVDVTFASYCGSIITTMAALIAGEVTLPCNALAAGAQGDANVPGTEGNFTASFNVDPATVSGSQATIGNFDIVFTGTQPVVAP